MQPNAADRRWVRSGYFIAFQTSDKAVAELANLEPYYNLSRGESQAIFAKKTEILRRKARDIKNLDGGKDRKGDITAPLITRIIR